jgi:queuine tRNA-ribosyltransferase
MGRDCLNEELEKGQNLFGIVQGGMYSDLRERSAKELVKLDFPGYALGGLSVGEDKETREKVIADTIGFCPKRGPGTSWVLESQRISLRQLSLVWICLTV